MKNEAIKNKMIDLHPCTVSMLSDILEKLVKEKLEEYGVHGAHIAISEIRLGATMAEEDPIIGVEANMSMNASVFELLKLGAKKLLK